MEAFAADPGNTPKCRICTSESRYSSNKNGIFQHFLNNFFAVVNDNVEKVLTQETSIGVHLQPKLPEVHGVGLCKRFVSNLCLINLPRFALT